MLLLLPKVIVLNCKDNKAMTAVEQLQPQGTICPGPLLGQHSYLTPHFCHNPLSAIKTYNNPICSSLFATCNPQLDPPIKVIKNKMIKCDK